MGYRLEAGETLAAGIKRILHEQTDAALAALQSCEPTIDQAIHDARKRFKKCRAVLRLVRDDIGDKVYKRENVAYRDAGRLLSDLRDAYSDIEMLDKIVDVLDDADIHTDAELIREKLQQRHQAVLTHVEENDTIAQVIADVEAAKARIDDLPIGSSDYSTIAESIERVYARGVKRMAKAYNQDGYPDIERFHEWRKRVKYLWYHTRLLKPIWWNIMDELADEIHDISDYLGDAHDIAELYRVIAPMVTTDDGGGRKLLAQMDYERAQLEKIARPLGQRIYAEDSEAFVARLGVYWQAWHTEQASSAEPALE